MRQSGIYESSSSLWQSTEGLLLINTALSARLVNNSQAN
jgi:hypothetical protein